MLRWFRIWPIDVAENSLLSAQIDAFDISDKFFPPSGWLPHNVKLYSHDITVPFPEEMLGVYDVVHFRSFLTLSTNQLRQMLDSAITLLS